VRNSKGSILSKEVGVWRRERATESKGVSLQAADGVPLRFNLKKGLTRLLFLRERRPEEADPSELDSMLLQAESFKRETVQKGGKAKAGLSKKPTKGVGKERGRGLSSS